MRWYVLGSAFHLMVLAFTSKSGQKRLLYEGLLTGTCLLLSLPPPFISWQLCAKSFPCLLHLNCWNGLWHLLLSVSQSITVLLFNAQCVPKLPCGSLLKPTPVSFWHEHVLAFWHNMIHVSSPSPTLRISHFPRETGKQYLEINLWVQSVFTATG